MRSLTILRATHVLMARRALELAAAALGLAAGVGLSSLATAQVATSGSFVLAQDTMNNGGAPTLSTSYRVDGSLAQAATIGEASSGTYTVHSGFWTALAVDHILTVEGTGTGAGSVTSSGIVCAIDAAVASGDCHEQAAHETAFTLVAAPQAGNQFDAWNGCDSVSTTTVRDDTCALTLTDSRTVTAGFTLLAAFGDRVWRDVNGDGVQDAGEPGLAGVDVTLSDGAAFNVSTTTVADGTYGFVDIPPGAYTVGIDTASLPVGVIPTYDLDGTGTAHSTALTLAPGDDRSDVDFGYQPLTDLRITKSVSPASRNGSGNLIYLIEVENLGPSEATGVTVTDNLPPELAAVATAGCAEDPGGVPTCTLGTIAPGGSASYEITATIVTAQLPEQITNSASVDAVEVDTDADNGADSVTVDRDFLTLVTIPLLGPAGLFGLAAMLAGLGVWLGRRRRVVS